MNKELKYKGKGIPGYTKNALVWLALRLDAENIGSREASDFDGLSRVAASFDNWGNANFALFRDYSGKVYYAEGSGNLGSLPL